MLGPLGARTMSEVVLGDDPEIVISVRRRERASDDGLAQATRAWARARSPELDLLSRQGLPLEDYLPLDLADSVASGIGLRLTPEAVTPVTASTALAGHAGEYLRLAREAVAIAEPLARLAREAPDGAISATAWVGHAGAPCVAVEIRTALGTRSTFTLERR